MSSYLAGLIMPKELSRVDGKRAPNDGIYHRTH